MVKNRATLTRSRTATTRIAVAAVAVVAAGALAACGSDSEGDATEKKPDNPGLQFSGIYDAEILTLTVNGKAPEAANTAARPVTRRWSVQSTCDGPGDRCVAIARSTAPTDNALNRDRMEFVREGGEWTRVTEPPERPCTANATKKKVDEPWVALHRTTLKAQGTATSGPVVALTGPVEVVQGGTCSSSVRGQVNLRRTGELPADTPSPAKTVASNAVTNAPSASLRGTYDVEMKPISANPPNFISALPPAKYRYVYAPMCLRDGSKCVTSVSSTTGEFYTALDFASGGFRRTATGPAIDCVGGAKGYSTGTLRIDLPAGSPNPLPNAKGTLMTRYLGGCPGTVESTVNLIRTGD